MKAAFYFKFCFIILFSHSNNSWTQSEVRVGMSSKELLAIYPAMVVEKDKNYTYYHRQATIHGIEDNWVYRVQKKSVHSIYFNHVIKSVTEKNFEMYKEAAALSINEYVSIHGTPDTLMENNDSLSLLGAKEEGYYVALREARWNNINAMKLKIGAAFFNNYGELMLIFKINFFSKDYPYFD